MTMGFDDDGDPPAGQTEEVEDNGDVRMGFEETTEEFVRNMKKIQQVLSKRKQLDQHEQVQVVRRRQQV
jgi:hypothetical protein